jgi:hypothetical protein
MEQGVRHLHLALDLLEGLHTLGLIFKLVILTLVVWLFVTQQKLLFVGIRNLA